MNKNQKILVSITFITSLIAGATTTKWNSYIHDLEGRFPELDRKIIRKAYRNFMWNGYTQQYTGIQDASDEDMDVLFMQEVQKLTSK